MNPEKAYQVGVAAAKSYVKAFRSLQLIRDEEIEDLARHMITAIMARENGDERPMTALRAREMKVGDSFPWYGTRDGVQFDVEVRVARIVQSSGTAYVPETKKTVSVPRTEIHYLDDRGKLAVLALDPELLLQVWRPSAADLRAELEAI